MMKFRNFIVRILYVFSRILNLLHNLIQNKLFLSNPNFVINESTEIRVWNEEWDEVYKMARKIVNKAVCRI